MVNCGDVHGPHFPPGRWIKPVEVPVQTGVQGLKGESVKEEWEDGRYTGSHMGKGEDAEEEGGTAEVIPVEVWTYWENTFEVRSCYQMQMWNYATASKTSTYHLPSSVHATGSLIKKNPKISTRHSSYSLDRPWNLFPFSAYFLLKFSREMASILF